MFMLGKVLAKRYKLDLCWFGKVTIEYIALLRFIPVMLTAVATVVGKVKVAIRFI